VAAAAAAATAAILTEAGLHRPHTVCVYDLSDTDI